MIQPEPAPRSSAFPLVRHKDLDVLEPGIRSQMLYPLSYGRMFSCEAEAPDLQASDTLCLPSGWEREETSTRSSR